jgi:hypothetical protein
VWPVSNRCRLKQAERELLQKDLNEEQGLASDLSHGFSLSLEDQKAKIFGGGWTFPSFRHAQERSPSKSRPSTTSGGTAFLA